MPKKDISNSPEALKSLSAKYEDILETQIKVLYSQMVNFIATSQIPLVHANAVLDLNKAELLVQLREGYIQPEVKPEVKSKAVIKAKSKVKSKSKGDK